MLQLVNIALPAHEEAILNGYQVSVNAKATFQEKVAEGKKLFKRYNVATNRVFKRIKDNLAEMSCGAIRCHYCEDSNANQVEHIYPKNFYPEKCFTWVNYCYACGPCNQPKSDKFSIFETVSGNEIHLKSLAKGTETPNGTALLIDPRTEDPLEYLFLDTVSTFKFTPFSDDALEKRRAEYTIDLLGLNKRSHLVRARQTAFSNFKSRLYTYVNKKESHEDKDLLLALIESLKSEHHQTVWKELIRQRTLHKEIDDLLNRAPEALEWI